MTNEEIIRALRDYNATLTALYGEGVKDGLFLAAADRLEELGAEVKQIKTAMSRVDADCDFCKHSGEHDTACNVMDCNCTICTADCPCKSCINGSHWEWSGGGCHG